MSSGQRTENQDVVAEWKMSSMLMTGERELRSGWRMSSGLRNDG